MLKVSTIVQRILFSTEFNVKLMSNDLLRNYVEKPFIEEVIDLRTGEIVPSSVFLDRDSRNVSIIRKDMTWVCGQ
jgi:hypothetical protein